MDFSNLICAFKSTPYTEEEEGWMREKGFGVGYVLTAKFVYESERLRDEIGPLDEYQALILTS